MPLADNPGAPVSAASAAVDRATGAAYWRKTSGLMWTMLAIWVLFSFGIHLFAPSLNAIRFLGFPLGYYMAAQGSLIVFVVSVCWFVRRQNRIDAEFGVQER